MLILPDMLKKSFYLCENLVVEAPCALRLVETFWLVETNLFGKDFVPVERDFPPSGNCFLLFHASFLQVETATETS